MLLCAFLVLLTYFNRLMAITDEAIIGVLPKVELHSHLHGSIRMSTLLELASGRNVDLHLKDYLDLDQCFKLFKTVHEIISDEVTLKRVVHEVLEDYMQENTLYLELRTTPRNLSDGTTKKRYVEVLVRWIEEHNLKYGHIMLTKLILSIDRSLRFNDASEVSQLAVDKRFLSNGTEYPVRTIVGLDFSGNPLGGKFSDFSPLFINAREQGLKLTVHTAELKELSEVNDSTDDGLIDETTSILTYG